MIVENRCFYCDARLKFVANRKDRILGTRKPTRDHLIPRALFPRYDMTQHQLSMNVVPCCAECNTKKGQKSPLVWMRKMDEKVAERIRQRLVAMGMWGMLWD